MPDAGSRSLKNARIHLDRTTLVTGPPFGTGLSRRRDGSGRPNPTEILYRVGETFQEAIEWDVMTYRYRG